MIIWKLDELMRRRRLKGREVARAMGIGENYLSRVRHEVPDRLSLTLLNRLCSVLQCSLSDLLEYRPDAPSSPETTWDAPLPAPVTLATSTVALAPVEEPLRLDESELTLEPAEAPLSWQARALAAEASTDEAPGLPLAPPLGPEAAPLLEAQPSVATEAQPALEAHPSVATESLEEALAEVEAEKPVAYVRANVLQSRLSHLRRRRPESEV